MHQPALGLEQTPSHRVGQSESMQYPTELALLG